MVDLFSSAVQQFKLACESHRTRQAIWTAFWHYTKINFLNVDAILFFYQSSYNKIINILITVKLKLYHKSLKLGLIKNSNIFVVGRYTLQKPYTTGNQQWTILKMSSDITEAFLTFLFVSVLTIDSSSSFYYIVLGWLAKLPRLQIP